MRDSFPLGRVVATRGALRTVSREEMMSALGRHGRGDWGELGTFDHRENDRALEEGGRLLSAYTSQDGTRFWIITESDRSVTTILLPEDY